MKRHAAMLAIGAAANNDPHDDAADLHGCEHERCVRCREAARVVQEQHDEAHDRELTGEDKRARGTEEPHPKVAQRTDELPRDLFVECRSRSTTPASTAHTSAFTASAANAA
jgi:hypothetical protein